MFDIQQLLASLGIGAPSGQPQGASAGQGPLGGQQPPAGPPSAPILSQPGGAGGAPTPGAGLMGSGMLGPLAASAAMLQASGPSRMPVGFGQVAGAGLGGLMQGAGADQQQAMMQQQQAALARIADKIGGMGQPQQQPGAIGGGMPLGGLGGSGMMQMHGGSGASPMGGMPLGGAGAAMGSNLYSSPAQNPFMQMMMRRRQGLVT